MFKKWLKAFQEHIDYATKIEELERLGSRLNVQIGNVEKHMIVGFWVKKHVVENFVDLSSQKGYDEKTIRPPADANKEAE